MDIRTYTGASLVETLGQVKAELGEEAVILSSRRVEDAAHLPPGHQVEVVAALPVLPSSRRGSSRPMESPTANPQASMVERPATPPRHEPRPWMPPRIGRDGRPVPSLQPEDNPVRMGETRSDASPQAPEPGLTELKGELAELRRALRDVGSMARHGSHKAWSPRHEESLRLLCGRGMGRPTACSVLDELEEEGSARSWDQSLEAALARRLPCAPADGQVEGQRVEALVGPTGVGKTTLLAKLLLNIQGMPHRRAGILSLDTKRVAAVDQIRRLAGILRTPLELLYRPGELGHAMDRLAGCDLILVDTPGTGPRERLALERVRSFLKELKPRHVHVALPASMRLEDQLAALGPWRQAGADRLVITKLDEATGLTGLVDLAAQAGLPFSYLATGQHIPDDLFRAEAQLLARWMLKPDSLGQDEQRKEGLARLKALITEARQEA
jgi:flagellar biosynthesis protein FlhF